MSSCSSEDSSRESQSFLRRNYSRDVTDKDKKHGLLSSIKCRVLPAFVSDRVVISNVARLEPK